MLGLTRCDLMPPGQPSLLFRIPCSLGNRVKWDALPLADSPFLKLVAMQLTPDEIQRLDRLSADLIREDDLGKVIRAHIRLEGILHEFLRLSVFHPSHLRKLNLDFDQNLTLALVMGLTEDLVRPLRSLGKLRNDFAHKDEMVLTKERVNAIYESLSGRDKERIHLQFLELKKKEPVIDHLTKFHQLSTHDQFVMIVLMLWAGLEQAKEEVKQATGRA